MAQPVDQFALARKRANQAATVSNQAQKGALERRFAQLGNMDSGARIKLEQQVDEQTAQQLSDANEGINAQEQQEMMRRQEIKEGRDFSRSEREASQGFAAGEADKGRKFSTSERVGSQDFASGEAMKGRQFATSERIGGQDFASGEAQKGRDFTTSERLGGQDFARGERLGGQQFSAGEASKGRKFAKDERIAGQAYGTKERQQAQAFAGRESEMARNSASTLAKLDRDARLNEFTLQMEAQKDQFTKTFGEEQMVNEANIAFNRQMMGDASAIPGLFDTYEEYKARTIKGYQKKANPFTSQPQQPPPGMAPSAVDDPFMNGGGGSSF